MINSKKYMCKSSEMLVSVGPLLKHYIIIVARPDRNRTKVKILN